MYASFLFNSWFGNLRLSKFRYRDRATIVGDILESINRDPKGKTKTSIMRGANLNFDQANKYLRFLLLCDLVKGIQPLSSQETSRYRLTKKGQNFLRDFDMWRLFLQTYNRQMI